MFANQTSMDPVQQAIDALNAEKPRTMEIKNLNGLNTEYSHSNKWWMYLPLANVLGKNYSNLELNLVRFSIPPQVMGSTTVSFKGYSFEFPTKLIDSETKEITTEYIVDEKWQNYRSLFKWSASLEGQINKVIDTGDCENITLDGFIPARVFLLDHFKNNVISFTFHNCWVKSFNDLQLEAANADEVHHSITLAYSNYTIDDIVDGQVVQT